MIEKSPFSVISVVIEERIIYFEGKFNNKHIYRVSLYKLLDYKE